MFNLRMETILFITLCISLIIACSYSTELPTPAPIIIVITAIPTPAQTPISVLTSSPVPVSTLTPTSAQTSTSSPTPTSTLSSTNYREKGFEYFNSRNYEKAIENLTKHIELNPKDVLAYIIRGASYNDSGNHAKAIENFNRAIELDPNSGQAYFEKGLTYFEMKEYSKAIENFNKVIEIEPNHPVAIVEKKKVQQILGSIPMMIPSFEILNKHPKLDCLNKTMDVFVDVFGIWVISTEAAPENYVLHTANVLAEFIDNDLDGIPDDADVLKYLVENNYVVPVWTTSIRTDFWRQARGTYCEDNIGMAASMYYDEDQWALGGIKKTGTWDSNLEEVWHVISQGWYGTYPQAFGNQDDINDTSRLREAMDTARGGKFDTVPSKYPDDAWYKYYDSTCEYHCQVSEYFYWALMSNIGALEPTLTNKCEGSKHEWNICTKSDLQKIDKSVYDLLNDPTFRLPKNIPLGRYAIQK